MRDVAVLNTIVQDCVCTYCGPAALSLKICGTGASRPKSQNRVHFPWIKLAQSQGGRIRTLWRTEFRQCSADIAPFCPFTFTSSPLTHHQLECPFSTHPDCKARPSSSLAQVPVSAGYSFPTPPLYLLSPRLINYMCTSTFRPPPYCLRRYQLAVFLSEAIL